MKDLQNNELVFQYAKDALSCLKKYLYDARAHPVLAIIGCQFLNPDEKKAIQQAYRIIDSSGDRMLDNNELYEGIQKILGEDSNEEEKRQFIANIIKNYELEAEAKANAEAVKNKANKKKQKN